MAITGQNFIRIGAPNSPQNSDNLYDAFNKIQDNFNELFSCSSSYTNFVAPGLGLSIIENADTGTVEFLNTGVVGLTAGPGIILSSSNGNVLISSTGNGGGGGATGTVTNVTVVSNSFTVTGSPINTAGVISIDIKSSQITTSATTRRVLFSTTVPAASGYEFLIKSVEISSGNINLQRLLVVSSGGQLNYTRTGLTMIGQDLGIPDAAMIGSTLQIGVTPSSSQPTQWYLQYQQI